MRQSRNSEQLSKQIQLSETAQKVRCKLCDPGLGEALGLAGYVCHVIPVGVLPIHR